MLPYKNRLHLEKDFKNLFKKGKGFLGNFLLVKSIPNHLEYSKLNIVVPKSVVKKATKRNFLKRISNSNIEKKWKTIKRGVNIILVYKKNPFLSLKSKKEIKKDLKEDIDHLFKKLKLLQ